MNKKVKAISVTLAIALLSATFAGCNNTDVSNQKQLVIWSKYVGKRCTPVMQIAKEWAKQKGCTVKVLQSTDDDGSSLIAAERNGKGPDVEVGVTQEQIMALVNASAIDQISEGTAGKQKYLSQTIDAGTYKGRLWGQPLTVELYGVYYNKDLINKVPNGWEELIKTGREKGLKWDFTDADIYDIFKKQYIKGSKFLKQLYEYNLITSSDSGEIPRQLFLNRKVGLLVSGSWFIGSCREQKINFGIMPIPSLNGEAKPIFKVCNFSCVCSGSKKKSLAQDFLKYAQDKLPEALAKQQGTIPAVKELADSKEFHSDSQFSQFIRLAEIN